MFYTLLKKRHFKILFFITLIIVLILALVPNDHISLEHAYADKIKHITAFFTLSLLLNRASSSIKTRIRNMVALLLFGIFIEIAQLYCPERSSSISDILADLVGILLFQLTFSFLKFVQFKIKKEE